MPVYLLTRSHDSLEAAQRDERALRERLAGLAGAFLFREDATVHLAVDRRLLEHDAPLFGDLDPAAAARSALRERLAALGLEPDGKREGHVELSDTSPALIPYAPF